MENKVKLSFDWFNGVVRTSDVRMFFDELEKISSKLAFENFYRSGFTPRGIRNYAVRYFLNGKSDFIVSYNPRREFDCEVPFEACEKGESQNPYIFLSVSGDGLRYISDCLHDFTCLLDRIGFTCSRCDIALDIFNRDNVFVPIVLAGFRNAYCPREGLPVVSSRMAIRAHRHKDPFRVFERQNNDGSYTYNLTFGSHGSRYGMFRLYDKFHEQGLDDTLNSVIPGPDLQMMTDPLSDITRKLYPDCYWYRAEIELHHEHAAVAFDQYMNHGDIRRLYVSAVRSMFTIRQQKSAGYRASMNDLHGDYDSFMNDLSTIIDFVQLKTDSPTEYSIDEFCACFERFAGVINAFEQYCCLHHGYHDFFINKTAFRYAHNFRYSVIRRKYDGLPCSDKDLRFWANRYIA